ncbi:hypothetical protein DFH07DRAFT_979165 [Mycena maculata]|uniref:Uncharacterized protein n=1 Tax=Mycena maculata TaxID=230809 RepID=A0AAD7K576_9AGAR|nr:hypothetical protein DFH07DRAFT_979165 [Mycena maculata]
MAFAEYRKEFLDSVTMTPSIEATSISSVTYCRTRGATAYPFLIVHSKHRLLYEFPVRMKLQGFDGPVTVSADPTSPRCDTPGERSTFSVAAVRQSVSGLVGTRRYDILHTMAFPLAGPTPPSIGDLLVLAELSMQWDHTRNGYPPTLFLALKNLFNGPVTSRRKASPLPTQRSNCRDESGQLNDTRSKVGAGGVKQKARSFIHMLLLCRNNFLKAAVTKRAAYTSFFISSFGWAKNSFYTQHPFRAQSLQRWNEPSLMRFLLADGAWHKSSTTRSSQLRQPTVGSWIVTTTRSFRHRLLLWSTYSPKFSAPVERHQWRGQGDFDAALTFDACSVSLLELDISGILELPPFAGILPGLSRKNEQLAAVSEAANLSTFSKINSQQPFSIKKKEVVSYAAHNPRVYPEVYPEVYLQVHPPVGSLTLHMTSIRGKNVQEEPSLSVVSSFIRVASVLDEGAGSEVELEGEGGGAGSRNGVGRCARACSGVRAGRNGERRGQEVAGRRRTAGRAWVLEQGRGLRRAALCAAAHAGASRTWPSRTSRSRTSDARGARRPWGACFLGGAPPDTMSVEAGGGGHHGHVWRWAPERAPRSRVFWVGGRCPKKRGVRGGTKVRGTAKPLADLRETGDGHGEREAGATGPQVHNFIKIFLKIMDEIWKSSISSASSRQKLTGTYQKVQPGGEAEYSRISSACSRRELAGTYQKVEVLLIHHPREFGAAGIEAGARSSNIQSQSRWSLCDHSKSRRAIYTRGVLGRVKGQMPRVTSLSGADERGTSQVGGSNGVGFGPREAIETYAKRFTLGEGQRSNDEGHKFERKIGGADEHTTSQMFERAKG